MTNQQKIDAILELAKGLSKEDSQLVATKIFARSHKHEIAQILKGSLGLDGEPITKPDICKE